MSMSIIAPVSDCLAEGSKKSGLASHDNHVEAEWQRVEKCENVRSPMFQPRHQTVVMDVPGV
jgi:hypothetical protein